MLAEIRGFKLVIGWFSLVFAGLDRKYIHSGGSKGAWVGHGHPNFWLAPCLPLP